MVKSHKLARGRNLHWLRSRDVIRHLVDTRLKALIRDAAALLVQKEGGTC